MKVCCIYEYTNVRKKNTLNYPKSAAMDFQERVRNSGDKRAISVRAAEGPLYYYSFRKVHYQVVKYHKRIILYNLHAYYKILNTHI